jgi:WD40 repeat protein
LGVPVGVHTSLVVRSKSFHHGGAPGPAFAIPQSSRPTDRRLSRLPQTGALLLTLEGHDGEVSCCAFSPDGTRIVTGSTDKTARLWDAATGALLKTLEGHTHVIYSCAFSPDGERIATASRDTTARLWHAAV